jgi:hypothetical protein
MPKVFEKSGKNLKVKDTSTVVKEVTYTVKQLKDLRKSLKDRLDAIDALLAKATELGASE